MNVPKLRFKEFDGEWEVVTLGEISKLSSSKRIHLSDYVNKGIPFYRGSEISKGGVTGNQELFISRELYEKIKAKYGVPKFNDLLVSAVGTLGNLWKVDEREFYYKDGNLILISDLKADTDYIFSYFSDVFGKNRLIDSAAGSNQKALTMVKMRSVKVPLPSEKEQKKIGEFFGIMDKKIQLQQQKIDLLQEQKKGYMQKIFSREIRFDGFKEPWEEKKLEDISKKITKGTTPKDKSWEGTVKYVKTDSIDQISGEILNKYFTSIEEHEGYLNRSQLKKGDILFSIVGTLGRVGIVKEKNLPANTNQQIAIIRLKEKVDKNFIFNVLKSSRIIAFIKSDSTVGAQPSLSLWQINELQVPYPNQEEQKKIGTFFKKIDDNIILQQQKSELLQKQKQGFMQQMFI